MKFKLLLRSLFFGLVALWAACALFLASGCTEEGAPVGALPPQPDVIINWSSCEPELIDGVLVRCGGLE